MQLMLNDIETDSPIRIEPARRLSDDEFYDLCAANPDLQIERTAEGEIAIMPHTGGETSGRNADLTMQLQAWAKRDRRGKVFDSNGEFILPNGAARRTHAGS
ncbi:MAG TPA: Uma2 family endonuclease [Bryobacteraceae bacterium]|nr:Uma2 family endonuclease [Bryobacteraceae bacterium]